MPALRFILGDQLSRDIPTLRDVAEGDVILMVEVRAEASNVRHHVKKITYVFSAMRHFASELQDAGFKVDYVKFDDADNTHALLSELRRAVTRHNVDEIILTAPSEYRVERDVESWQGAVNIPVSVYPDTRYLCARDEFAHWARGRKTLRMEDFYRDMRRRYNILMEGDAPIGGHWNFDAENRKPPKEGLNIPPPYRAQPDAVTQEVVACVQAEFSNHFGVLDNFHFAVDRAGALAALQDFITYRLPNFGTYQDAMIEGEPWMFHSHLSLYINFGLLSPIESIHAAEHAYQSGEAPLNAVEGFIRQILGWREYVRGIYWLNMPDYAVQNALNAQQPLPDFYWTGATEMNCIAQSVRETHDNAYAHHIQRLMVLGNFALLIGAHPDEVNEWYLLVYADALEWVEMPNVTGMILYADGGQMASKPYAASGAYINRMSNYCKNCRYKVTKKTGPEACPFNYLYWDFLDRNADVLRGNHRLRMPYRTLDKWDEDRKDQFREDAARFFENLDAN